MTEQEPREQFEKWANKVNVSKYNEVYFVIFKSGYLLAQEKIKAKDATIAEARFIIQNFLNFYNTSLEDKEKAKVWLEQNK